MLDIDASYHHIQFQGQLMIETQENGEKLHFGHVGPKFGPPKFFIKLVVRNCSKLSSSAI